MPSRTTAPATAALITAGWPVMRITWRQLHDEPEAIARDLRAFLAG